MEKGKLIIHKGQVELVEEAAEGLRIKARIDSDLWRPLEEIPYAFPLLPKTVQSVPKVGEGVFVFTEIAGNDKSQRYYIGPIISQPQYQEECSFAYGRGVALSLIDGGLVGPDEKISNYSVTNGSFPKANDIAVIGRGSQDLVMRENSTGSDELDIRCGIRNNAIQQEDGNALNEDDAKRLKGKVVFNKEDPAYIQMKYRKGLTSESEQEASSITNIVSDKINIISNKDVNQFNLTDQESLIKEDELDEIMSKLHQIPHGDTLIKLLGIIIKAIVSHVHPYAGRPAIMEGYVKDAADFSLPTILSKHVRIS